MHVESVPTKTVLETQIQVLITALSAIVPTHTIHTVDRENFTVKKISWLRPTVKIKHAKNRITQR